MTTSDVRVLLGDSTPSELPVDVLDLVTEVVHCVRDVAVPYGEADQLARRGAEAARVTEAIIKELGTFGKQSEVGVRATAAGASRPEVRAHGEEAVEAITRMVATWQRQHDSRREATQAQVSERIAGLRGTMSEALERFLLPRRLGATVQRFHRFFDGQRYLDTGVVEPLGGIRVMLTLADPEPEAPRKLRSLIGKGHKVQVGTRLSRIRRIEEAVTASIDDMLLLDAERGPGRLRLLLSKKSGTPDTLRVEIERSDDGLLHARVKRGEEAAIESPPGDMPVLEALWTAMDAERERVMACPASLVELSLDGKRVEDAAGLLAVAERVMDVHRSTISLLARHSPNPAELTIKVESDGKREEVWIRRDELAQHLLALPEPLRQRLSVPELTGGAVTQLAEASASVTQVAMSTVDESHSMPIELEIEPVFDSRGAPRKQLVEDLSLTDLVVDDADSEASGCTLPITQINRR